MKELRPRELFPRRNSKGWRMNWTEYPLTTKVLNMEAQNSPALQRAMRLDLTEEFIKTLYAKATNSPPENITIEIKGQTRSGKSTLGIFLCKLISYWWGLDFTVDNILPNQTELLYRLKDAKYGETFLVDEQLPEDFGEGIVRESGQLLKNLNICAKKCNNLVFVYPQHFTSRNAPFGLETFAKDTQNKLIKAWYHDLERKSFGFAGVYPRGYIIVPKYVDEDYKKIKKERWSKKRKDNFAERGYDFDSLLEEQYEEKKDAWIEEVRSLDGSMREQKKLELASELANDDFFMKLSSKGKKEAFLKMKIARGEFMELTVGEIESVVSMAAVLEEEHEAGLV